MRSTSIFCGLSTLFISSQLVLAGTQDAASPSASQEITPEARQLIDRMNTFYTSLDAATLKASLSISDEAMPGGMKQTSNLAIGRPNLLLSEPEGPGGGFEAACNGTELTMAMTPFKIYSVSKAPKNFQNLVNDPYKTPETAESTPGIELTQDPTLMTALTLFSENPGQKMLRGVENAYLAGEETFNGTDAYKLVLASEIVPTDTNPNPTGNAILWIAKGDKPWLLGVEPQFPEGMDLSARLTYENWSEGPPSQGYVLTIPENWTKVDDLMQSVMDKAAEQMGELDMPDDASDADPFHPTEGSPAPDFTLTTLDGSEKVTLSALKGKVVVLDFWATWCAPCVAGLPTVDSVTKAFKDQGVEFYAVDLREKASRVSKFMTKKGWDFTVLMDEDGEVAKSFDVGGIPHSVLIDREGVIRHVHIGFGGKEALQKQLEEELRGLVKETATTK